MSRLTAFAKSQRGSHECRSCDLPDAPLGRMGRPVLASIVNRSSFLIGELHLSKLGETVVVHSNLPRESSDRQRPRHSADDAGGALLRFSPTGSDGFLLLQNQRSPWSPLIRLLSGGSSMRFHCWSLSMSSRPLCFYPFCIVGLKGEFVSFLAAPSNVGKSRWPSIAPRA